MAFCLSFSWNFIDYFKLILKSDGLFVGLFVVLFYCPILNGWEKDAIKSKK